MFVEYLLLTFRRKVPLEKCSDLIEKAHSNQLLFPAGIKLSNCQPNLGCLKTDKWLMLGLCVARPKCIFWPQNHVWILLCNYHTAYYNCNTYIYFLPLTWNSGSKAVPWARVRYPKTYEIIIVWNAVCNFSTVRTLSSHFGILPCFLY